MTVADIDPITAGAEPALIYLSQAARSLAVPDPVQGYLDPIVGQWRDLHAQAELWRLAAGQVEQISEKLTIPLGGLDAVWDGRGSDTFIRHMQTIGAAGRSASDAMAAMAEVLDRTADGVHQLVVDLVDLLCDGADRISSAMMLPVDGEAEASRQLGEIREYSRQVFDAVRELLEAFAAACKDLDAGQPFAAVRMASTFPQQAWSFQPDLPHAPAPPAEHLPAERVPAEQLPAEPPQREAAASELAARRASTSSDSEAFTGGDVAAGGDRVPASGAVAGGGVVGGAAAGAGPAEPGLRTLAIEAPPGGATAAPATSGLSAEPGSSTGARGGFTGGFLPMAGFGAGMGSQDIERKKKSSLAADPTEVFGKPIKTAPPVIGEDDD